MFWLYYSSLSGSYPIEQLRWQPKVTLVESPDGHGGGEMSTKAYGRRFKSRFLVR